MHPDVKQQKTSYVSSHFRLFAGYSTRHAHQHHFGDSSSTPALHTKHGSPARGSAASYLTSSWLLTPALGLLLGQRRAEDARIVFLQLPQIHNQRLLSLLSSSTQTNKSVSEIYWPNNNLCSRPTGPSSSINLNLHRNTIRAHIYLWQHSLHYSSLCGGNLIRSSSWN